MIYFMPTVDGKFLVKNREEMSKDNFYSKPYIVGCTNSEGCGLLSTQQYPNFNEGISKKDCLKSISELIGYLFFVSTVFCFFNVFRYSFSTYRKRRLYVESLILTHFGGVSSLFWQLFLSLKHLLFVRIQAKEVIVNRLFQGRNNVT